MKEPAKTYSIYIPIKLHKLVKEFAEEHRVSVSWVVYQALEHFLKKRISLLK